VDACPYDALRDGADIELAHTDRSDPMIDLMAIAAVDRETEVTYIRRERDWAARAEAAGRIVDQSRLLPVLPPALGGVATNGNGHGHGNGHAGHDHGTSVAVIPTPHE
jgi:hypothetical protein